MSEQTARLVKRIRTRLQRTTRRMTWADLAFGAAVAGGTVAATWLLAVVLEASLWLGTTARTALAAAVGTVAIGVGAALLARPIGRLLGLVSGPSEEVVARKVGRHHPQVADRLVNLLQLVEGRRSHAPAPLIDEAVQHLAEDLDEVSFREVEDFGRARRALRLASLPLAAVLAFLLLAPSTFLDASERLLAPGTAFNRPAPFQLSVTPGSVRLVQGDSLRVTVRPSGGAPSEAVLLRRAGPSTPSERIPLRPDSAGTFRHTLAPVQRAFQYRVAAGPVRTRWYDVEVASRPLVRRLEVTVTPPAYTGLPSRTLDPNVGDVSALPGATVSVSAALGGPSVETARLVFDDESSRSLEVEDGTATGGFTLRREGHYRLRLQSASGPTNRDPIRYQLSLQADARPSVSFLAPTGPSDISDDLSQELRVQLSDDYGFSRAALFYRLSEERFGAGDSSFASVRLPLPAPGQRTQELVHQWLLAQDTGLEPEPGDVITYYVKAWDNNTVAGPRSGRTATQRLRMPSVSEQYEQLDQTQGEAEEQMNRLRQRSDSVQQQFNQLRKELRRTREADWQDRRTLERLQNKQQSLDQGVEKLSKTVEQMTRQMQRNGLSDSEMSRKFQELKRVVDEMKSPELQKALEQLRKAMQSGDMRQMQRAMKEVREQEASSRKQLERVKSLFEQLKAQQKLQEMARRAGELSERQKTLREKTRERMQESGASDEQQPSEEKPSSEDAAPTETAASDSSSRSPSNRRDASSADSSGAPSRSPSAENEQPPSDSAAARPSRAAQPDSSARSPASDARKPSSEKSPSQRSESSQKSGAKKSGANKDLAEEQKRAAEQMRKLEKALEEARKEMDDVQSAPREQLRKMNQQLQRKNLPQKMRQNSQQLQKNQLQDAQQGQQRMQQSLEQMQKQLTQMKSQMQGQQRQLNLAGLRAALENTLRLSKRQESLRGDVRALASEGPALRPYARDQKTLSDGLRTVTDSLQSIAERVPEMSRTVQKTTGNALRAMKTATTALDERNAGKATGHQKTSMRHLNELALLLSNLLEQLQNQQQGSGSGMSMQQMVQKLQQMSGQQQKLNQQIQQNLNQKQGQRLSTDQAQRRKELAKQQRRIKQQLQDLGVGSEARDQVMGDLEKIAKQMEQSARELQDGERPSRDLIDRQRQIMTRLLNAQQSLRTQGKQKQRQGRRSDGNYEQRPPGDRPASEETDQLRRDLIRALEMGYSSDYEELIRRYFELLRDRTSDPDGASSSP
ncbi:MAG: DUF4175 family protein [Salinivenus sp.]